MASPLSKPNSSSQSDLEQGRKKYSGEAPLVTFHKEGLTLARFNQATCSTTVTLGPSLKELPGLKAAIPADLLSPGKDRVLIKFTFSLKAFHLEGSATLEIYEENRTRVVWRSKFDTSTPITIPVTIVTADINFGCYDIPYSVIVRAKGAGHVEPGVFQTAVWHVASDRSSE